MVIYFTVPVRHTRNVSDPAQTSVAKSHATPEPQPSSMT